MYLVLSPGLPDGDYLVPGNLKWHERLRLKLCKRLFLSVKKSHSLQIRTTTGSNSSYLRVR
ncbi:hypothetical protein LCGC14_0629410 [marine sediment metagenome]|uniref:Uncharacterized protein n=1 Tax=marine sediment metagenome TaxID=412755 RepID=A0A0F9TNY4_9ZZZZ